MRHIILPIIFLLGILLSSCHTQRHIEPAPEHYQTLSQKANVTLHIDQHKYSLACTLWMWKDELVVVSLQPMAGIESHRIEADQDSVTIIDKLNLKYTTVAYKWAERYIYPAPSLQMIQQFITQPIEHTSKKNKKKQSNLTDFWINGHQLSVGYTFSQREYNKLTTHKRQPLKKYKRVTLREILPI